MGISYFKCNAETGAYGSGGGAPVASDNAIKVLSIDYSAARGPLAEDATDKYVPSAVLGGAFNPSGSFECLWRPTAMAVPLAALMGDSSSPYTLSEPTSCVIQIGETVGATSLSRDFYGVGFKSCELTFEAKEYVKTKWEWFASDIVNSTYDTALTFASEAPLIFWSASLTMGGSTIYCKSASMTIDRALDEEQYVLGSYKRYRLARTGMTSVTGTLTFTESEFSELARAIYGTTGGTSMPAANTLGSGSLVITALRAGGSTGAVITAPIVYNVADYKMSGVGEIEKTIEYQVYDTTGSDFNIAVTA